MAEISASMVMKLRKISGQGIMDCKEALDKADGDLDKAMEILRKKGLSTMVKRAQRETSEGLVVGKHNQGGKFAVLATLCCETDFVAKSKDFAAAANTLADYALVCRQQSGPQSILETIVDGKKFDDILTEIAGKTGEKTQIGDYERFELDGPGLISTYIHFNSKVGTMVQIDTNEEKIAESQPLRQIANDIAMHITATKPLALDKDGLDPEIIERERTIYAEQVKNKPPNIIDKIVAGKIHKFFAENCLLEQKFVKDDSKTVAQVLSEAAKQAGGEAEVKKFVRFEVG
ncbi:MAG: elongation factor Ts [Sedimentisphaerales bacterium]|nr:elongation factor Ts [Sedimentisphaerales bacterium]